MPRSITLFRLFGTQVRAHYSWPIAPVFITIVLGAWLSEGLDTSGDIARGYGLAAIIALFLAASILVHEFAHVLVARRLGIHATGITLFALGGVSHFDDESRTAYSNIAVSLAGPVASIAIGLTLVVLATFVDQPAVDDPASSNVVYFYTEDGVRAHAHLPYEPNEPTMRSQASQNLNYLAFANIAVGLFNLLPLYPLDGGRILSAIIWAITRNRQRGIRIAALTGQLGAAAIIAYGAYNLFFGELLPGIWLTAIGVFLMDAAIGAGGFRRLPE